MPSLRDIWTKLDSAELRLVLDELVGGPGQYDGQNPNKLYLPRGHSSCQVVLTFGEGRIIGIDPGPAFDSGKWKQVCDEIEKSLLVGALKVGREYSFSSFRVLGSWRGNRSGVQILPPPDDAPRAPVEMAEHPFILEFPVKASDFWPVTNYRRIREHRNLTLVLNVLLAGHTRRQLRQSGNFWARVPCDNGQDEIQWVQQFFFAKLGKAVIDELSAPANERLIEVEPEEYYTTVGHDGKGLRVPD